MPVHFPYYYVPYDNPIHITQRSMEEKTSLAYTKRLKDDKSTLISNAKIEKKNFLT